MMTVDTKKAPKRGREEAASPPISEAPQKKIKEKGEQARQDKNVPSPQAGDDGWGDYASATVGEGDESEGASPSEDHSLFTTQPSVGWTDTQPPELLSSFSGLSQYDSGPGDEDGGLKSETSQDLASTGGELTALLEGVLDPEPGRDARTRVSACGEDTDLIINLDIDETTSSHQSENSEEEA